MPANLACTAVSRSDQPHPTCNSSVRKSASNDGKPRNRRTAPLLLPNCRHSEGNSPNRICQSSSSVMRKDYPEPSKESIVILALMGVTPSRQETRPNPKTPVRIKGKAAKLIKLLDCS